MTLLEQVLELTARVEQQLDAGDWSGAASLEAQRQALLGQLCDGDRIKALDQDERQVLRALLARNQRAIERLEAERRGLASMAGALARAPSAVRAYQDNQAADGTAWSGELT